MKGYELFDKLPIGTKIKFNNGTLADVISADKEGVNKKYTRNGKAVWITYYCKGDKIQGKSYFQAESYFIEEIKYNQFEVIEEPKPLHDFMWAVKKKKDNPDLVIKRKDNPELILIREPLAFYNKEKDRFIQLRFEDVFANDWEVCEEKKKPTLSDKLIPNGDPEDGEFKYLHKDDVKKFIQELKKKIPNHVEVKLNKNDEMLLDLHNNIDKIAGKELTD